MFAFECAAILWLQEMKYRCHKWVTNGEFLHVNLFQVINQANYRLRAIVRVQNMLFSLHSINRYLPRLILIFFFMSIDLIIAFYDHAGHLNVIRFNSYIVMVILYGCTTAGRALVNTYDYSWEVDFFPLFKSLLM